MWIVLEYVIYISIFIGFFAISFYVLTFISSLKRKPLLLEDSELPFVSVIIPAWNEEESTETTLRSILESDYPNFEVLFVDDGSKDKTLEIAKRFESKKVKVFTKSNGGKASALNFGIKRAKGEIIFTMDADTIVAKDSMKKMARYFKDEKVMSVTPAMLIHSPDTVLRRMQHIEYLLGIFLRKVFATLNAIYIAPGAFTCYRKKFFDDYGGYVEGNITEDLELAMRIQAKGYKTENCNTANIYTLGPPTFKTLSKQRIRWYTGLITNFWNYRWMVGRNFGDLGVIVLPIGWVTILFSLFITFVTFVTSIPNMYREIIFWGKINFGILGSLNLSWYAIELSILRFLSDPLSVFFIFSVIITFGYLKYAELKTGKIKHLGRNIFLFFFFFIPLFCYWWIVSFIKVITNKKISWR